MFEPAEWRHDENVGGRACVPHRPGWTRLVANLHRCDPSRFDPEEPR